MDFNQLADRHLVAQFYEGLTAGDMPARKDDGQAETFVTQFVTF